MVIAGYITPSAGLRVGGQAPIKGPEEAGPEVLCPDGCWSFYSRFKGSESSGDPNISCIYWDMMPSSNEFIDLKKHVMEKFL